MYVYYFLRAGLLLKQNTFKYWLFFFSLMLLKTTFLALCVCLFIVRDFVRYKFYFFSREKKNFFLFFSTNAAAVAFRCRKKLILSIVWCAVCERVRGTGR